MEKTVTKKVDFTKNGKERNSNERRTLTPEERASYAKECTALSKKYKVPFELVMLYKKDIKRVISVIETCKKIKIKKDSEIYTKLVEGGQAKIEALKELRIPFKGVNINKLDILKLIEIEE